MDKYIMSKNQIAKAHDYMNELEEENKMLQEALEVMTHVFGVNTTGFEGYTGVDVRYVDECTATLVARVALEKVKDEDARPD